MPRNLGGGALMVTRSGQDGDRSLPLHSIRVTVDHWPLRMTVEGSQASAAFVHPCLSPAGHGVPSESRQGQLSLLWNSHQSGLLSPS